MGRAKSGGPKRQLGVARGAWSEQLAGSNVLGEGQQGAEGAASPSPEFEIPLKFLTPRQRGFLVLVLNQGAE